MKQRAIVLLLIVICVLGAFYNRVSSVLPVNYLFLPVSINSPNLPWLKLYHSNGALFISTPTDAQAASSQGLSFSLFESHFMTPKLRQEYERLRMVYVDSDPWSEIQGTCGTLGGVGTCSLTYQQKRTILANVKNHLAETKNDPLIVGYLILDDYPGGDVRDVMQGIHDLVVEANRTAVSPRFTQCNFASRLDTRNTVNSAWQSHHTMFDTAMTNYSPTACEVVMFYFEGYHSPANYNHPELIDWSMSTLLPYAIYSLKARGWDPATQPLIGSAQLYNWTEAWWKGTRGTSGIWLVKPYAANIATQIEAYCKVGAIAITGYAWNDPYHPENIKHEIFNDGVIRDGYLSGIQKCRSEVWNMKVNSAPIH